jgi:outer membrane protein assembly factor BamB
MMNRLLSALAAVALLAGLAACSKDKDVDPPAELVDMKPLIKIDRVWSTGVGGGTKALRLGLNAASDGERLYAGSHDGDVLAFDLKNGKTLWHTNTKLPLAGGPGVGAGRVVIGTSEGDVLAFNSADGAQVWKVRINGEVLSAPAVAPGVAVVRTVDGRLTGLDLGDGHELWSTEQQVPRLSLRGTASPVIVGDVVVCGFDNGKVLAVGLTDGTVQWESQVASSKGRTELARLVDIDSSVQVIDKDVYVAGFQGRSAMLALDSGQVWWSRDESSDRGLVVDGENIYVTDSDGDIQALKRRDGTPLWKQPALHRRGLSGPVVDGPAIVVADFEGYVHWLDAATGELLARASTDGNRVTNRPLVVDGTVYVLTDGGKLSAFRRETPPPEKKG